MLLSRVRIRTSRTSPRSTCVRKSENVGAGLFGVRGAIATTSISRPNVSRAILRPDPRDPSMMRQRPPWTIACVLGIGCVIWPIVSSGLLRDHAVTTALMRRARPTDVHPPGVSWCRRPDRVGRVAPQPFAMRRHRGRADVRGRGRRDRLGCEARDRGALSRRDSARRSRGSDGAATFACRPAAHDGEDGRRPRDQSGRAVSRAALGSERRAGGETRRPRPSIVPRPEGVAVEVRMSSPSLRALRRIASGVRPNLGRRRRSCGATEHAERRRSSSALQRRA